MTTYELPPEPPVGTRVKDVTGSVWHAQNREWTNGREWAQWHELLLNHGPLTLIEPDPWPTEPLIVASVDGGGPQLLSIITRHAAVTMTSAIVRRAEHTLTNVVPVTVVPVAALPVLWSALDQWVCGTLRGSHEDLKRLVGAVINLREQTDALGVDL